MNRTLVCVVIKADIYLILIYSLRTLNIIIMINMIEMLKMLASFIHVRMKQQRNKTRFAKENT